MKALTKAARYKKAIVCAVGIVSLISFQFFGVDLGPIEPILADVIVGVLTVVGVYASTNE